MPTDADAAFHCQQNRAEEKFSMVSANQFELLLFAAVASYHPGLPR